ncbi:FAD binding domain protein [Daldinia eschscholtzii]|nr:FAD binding domain protein [Daldinia eschscholtzii]
MPPHVVAADSFQCRCFPGDVCWPSRESWSNFNATLDGKLVATVPIASVCHNSSFTPYNAEACMQLRGDWTNPYIHSESSSSVMAPFFANMSCDPFTTPESQCVIGTYVQYAVNASSAKDFQLALAFARNNNIRLAIRNTGHDYLGKSSGAGALAIWTHHLKDITVQDYVSEAYAGKALRVGAGVQVREALAAAHVEGLVVVGGDSSTVGLAGGYSQGGGHGPLASTFGLGADQVLEWEVITATGQHLNASASNNTDLYWALSGGGGGTYGVVLSATVKAHPDGQVAVANLTFANSNSNSEAYYETLKVFLGSLPGITDRGAVCIWLLTPESLTIQSLTAPGLTSQQLKSLLQPVLDKLDQEGISHDYAIKEFPTFLESYHSMSIDPLAIGGSIGGRLIPSSLLLSNSSITSLVEALRFIVSKDVLISGLSLNVSRTPTIPNSVNPAWRTTGFSAVIGRYWNDTNFEANIADQHLIRNVLIPKLASITPRGGAYLNEADFGQPDWQYVFYGDNYSRLLAIKQKYDPDGIFYGLTSVGSEMWQSGPDGRICKT